MKTGLVPGTWVGSANNVDFYKFNWLKELPKDTYCALWLSWPQHNQVNLPTGHNLYVVSFYMEAVDIQWVKQQSQIVNAPIIVLSDSNYYNWDVDNVFSYTYYFWPDQLEQINEWFPGPFVKNIQYKASAFCNRITQSKLLIFTKLIETMGADNCLLSLSDWIEERSVHYKEPTGRPAIDNITEIFFNKYQGKTFRIDDFDFKTQSADQSFTSNPGTPAYQNSALHFTNESFHYSYMQEDRAYIHPGPFLTEKTFKCLAGGTGFVPVGQFETYKTLSKLGCEFNYKFDMSWDNDSGNLSRLESIMKLIDFLEPYDAMDIFNMTKESSKHNRNHVLSGKFSENCQKVNYTTIDTIISTFNR